jgi:hypothetical protein
MSSFWLSWWPVAWNPFAHWRKTTAADYETILESLSRETERIEEMLVDIKTRRRKTIRMVLIFMLSAWVAVTAVVWIVMRGAGESAPAWMSSAAALGLVLGTPVFTVVLHRVLNFWYRCLERAQGTFMLTENHLKTLRRQQRATINDIKKVTDFEQLRRLLDCYDDETKARKQERRSEHSGAGITRSKTQPRIQLKSKASMPTLGAALPKDMTSTPLPPALATPRPTPAQKLAPPLYTANGFSSLGPVVNAGAVPPPPRSWLDKVADLILGTDPYGTTLEEQQYALICRGCMRHNGLVPKQEFEEVRALNTNKNIFAQRARHSIRGGHRAVQYRRHLHRRRARQRQKLSRINDKSMSRSPTHMKRLLSKSSRLITRTSRRARPILQISLKMSTHNDCKCSSHFTLQLSSALRHGQDGRPWS